MITRDPEYDRWYDAVVEAVRSTPSRPLICPYRCCPEEEHNTVAGGDGDLVALCPAAGRWYKRSDTMPGFKPIYHECPQTESGEPNRWVQHNPLREFWDSEIIYELGQRKDSLRKLAEGEDDPQVD